jgi:hypothetical protein
MMFVPHRKHTYGPPRSVTWIALPLYMQMMFVPHRKHTYGPPRPVMWIALPFHMQMMFVPHRKRTYGPPQPVTWIAVPFHVQIMFVPHRKRTYGPPQSVTWIALPLYMQMMFVPHRKHTYGPPRLVAGTALRFYLFITLNVCKLRMRKEYSCCWLGSQGNVGNVGNVGLHKHTGGGGGVKRGSVPSYKCVRSGENCEVDSRHAHRGAENSHWPGVWPQLCNPGAYNWVALCIYWLSSPAFMLQQRCTHSRS